MPAQGSNLLTVGAGGRFPTIGSAVSAAKPGDTVEITAGTYNETLNLNKQGAPNSDITVRAAPGAGVTLNGSVKLDGAAYLKWIGIAVQNSPTYGLSGGNVRNVVFQSCKVANTRDGGLDIFSGSNVVVDGCDISGTNAKGLSAGGEALSISRTQGFELRNNKVHDSGEEGVDTKDGTTAGTVHHNDVWGNRGPNIYVDSAQNIAVYNNKVHGATSSDKPNIMVAVESYAQKQLADNIDIHNNAIFNGAGSGVGFWKEGGGTISNVKVQNNRIWGNKGQPITGAPDTGGNLTGNIEAPPAAATSGGPTASGSPSPSTDPSGSSSRPAPPSSASSTSTSAPTSRSAAAGSSGSGSPGSGSPGSGSPGSGSPGSGSSGSGSSGSAGKASASRDIYKQPFRFDSPWNLPLAQSATVQPAHLSIDELYPDVEDISVDPNAPVKQLSGASSGQVHVDPTTSGNGHWNNCATFVTNSPDQKTVIQGQPLKLSPGGNPSWSYGWPAESLTGTGIPGCHGGSGLSGIGGTIRAGDLTGSGPVTHALKLSLNREKSCSKENGGHRWPATKADSGYQGHYGGSDPQIAMGSLLSLPANVDLSGITQPDVKKVAQALRDYGGYVVDSSGGSTTGSFDVQSSAVSQFPNINSAQMRQLITQLDVVTNSAQDTPGGGALGTPRRVACAGPFADGTGGPGPGQCPVGSTANTGTSSGGSTDAGATGAAGPSGSPAASSAGPVSGATTRSAPGAPASTDPGTATATSAPATSPNHGPSAAGSGPTSSESSSSGSGSGAAAGGRSAAAVVTPALVDVASVLRGGREVSLGTGVVVSSGGQVITNAHVVAGAVRTRARDVADGRTYAVRVVARDPTHDLAVLQLRNASGLPVAALGSPSTLHRGDTVTALGNAGGANTDPVATAGTVTALGRRITATDGDGANPETLSGLIQTDARIRAGDSGGALVDDTGRVVGITTAGGAEGAHSRTPAGFAIPIDQAMTFVHGITATAAGGES